MGKNDSNVRLLWLEDGNCIVFNSYLKKVSRVEPAGVGHEIERILSDDRTDIWDDTIINSEETSEAIRLLRNISGGGQMSPPLEIFEKKFYRTLILAPSARCNLRCIYCSGNAGERSDDEMTQELAKAAIDYFFQHCAETGPYTLQFHGAGEPMTAPEIVRFAVNYAKDIASKKGQRLFTRISTNGVMSEEQALWLSQHMDHISLSLDGVPEYHNAQRPFRNGGESYDAVCRSLKIFRKYGALKRINIVVTNEGMCALEDNLKHIASLCGAVDVRVLPMEYCGRCEKTNPTPINRKELHSRLSEIVERAEGYGLRIVTATEQVDYCTDTYCQACGYAMCVTPSGLVSTCVEAMSQEESGISELFIGQYQKEQGTFEIDWNKVAKLRQRNYHNLETCRECVFRTNCAGNCLIRAARKHGTVFSVDEDACAMTKAILSEQFKRLSSSVQDGNEEQHDPEELSFREMRELSEKVFRGFAQIESRPWSIEAAIMELTKQLGDLSKLILSQENYYLPSRHLHPAYMPSKERIGNELADMLHWLIWIADYYHISIPEAFVKARKDELGYIEDNR